MQIIIAGSRGLSPSLRQIDLATKRLKWNVVEVFSGLCPDSPDIPGKRWAEARGIPVREFPANWERYGKLAGKVRNEAMAKKAQAALVWWNGRSPGSRDLIQRMRKKNKLVYIVYQIKKAT